MDIYKRSAYHGSGKSHLFLFTLSAASMQGLSQPRPSMLLTMLRQAILPVLLALALRAAGDLNMIWFSFVIAEALGVPLAFILWKNRAAEIVKPMFPDADSGASELG